MSGHGRGPAPWSDDRVQIRQTSNQVVRENIYGHVSINEGHGEGRNPRGKCYIHGFSGFFNEETNPMNK